MNDFDDLRDDIFEGAVAEPEAYQDQANTFLLPEGKYLFKLNKISIDKDQDGAIRNPKAPQIVLNEVEVAGDHELAGRRAFFLRVRSNAYERKPGVKASELGDLIRGIDQSYNWGNSIRTAMEFLQKAVDTGEGFRARVRWSAFDSDHWKAEGGSDLSKDDQKALAKVCRLSGMKHFPTQANGKPIPEWVGPSGATVQARLEIAQVFPSESKYK